MGEFLVFQSDFGLDDAAVSAMEGVSFGVDPSLQIRHLTHQITPFNIFEASYRLWQAISYWPKNTVFVSVVDPGVGSDRMSVVAATENGNYVVTPNNGTLTHINEFIGIKQIRQIDETVNRLKNSQLSYTFHGRDVYAYTGARLASGIISFDGVGPLKSNDEIVLLDLYGSHIEGNLLKGQVDILDGIFGSLWTSISFEDFKKLNFEFGDNVQVDIYKDNVKMFSKVVKYGHSFADVSIGECIVYMNSVNHMAIAVNQGSFTDNYGIGVGSGWVITMSK